MRAAPRPPPPAPLLFNDVHGARFYAKFGQFFAAILGHFIRFTAGKKSK